MREILLVVKLEVVLQRQRRSSDDSGEGSTARKMETWRVFGKGGGGERKSRVWESGSIYTGQRLNIK
ncbi:hypothetical protein Droror1_Dr00017552 [Drosera rotundifolia]